MQQVTVEPDTRGESESYEAFNLVCREGARVVWIEGIRKDRAAMYDDARAFVEAELLRLKNEVPR